MPSGRVQAPDRFRVPKRPHRRALDTNPLAAGVTAGDAIGGRRDRRLSRHYALKSTAEIAIQRHPQESFRTVGIAGARRGLAVDAQA